MRSRMRITVLGCGGSLGVPLSNGNWGTCDPENPRNRRSRPAIFIETSETRLLVDAGPDLRNQAIAAGIDRIDAVLFTHAHADHIHGIDDLRPFFFKHDGPIPAYADDATHRQLEERFGYAVDTVTMDRGIYRPILSLREVAPSVTIGDLTLDLFHQSHGSVETLGFRCGNFAYCTDAAILPDEAFDLLGGIDTWIVDACREEPHVSHAHLERTLEWIERVKPRRAYLTHMNHTMDYDRLMNSLPTGVEPAYDGLVVEI